MYPSERNEAPGIMEIVRASGPIEEFESFAARPSVHLIPPPLPPPVPHEDRSPGSGSRPLSPGSGPRAIGNGLTPSAFLAVDVSMPPPRRSQEFITSKQDFSSTVPKVAVATWNIQRVIIVITIVLLAVAAYLLIRPR
jgi:hypothetical protein